MSSVDEQIEAVEKELRELPHHKATDHHIGRLRAKLSRLKERQIDSQSKKGGGGGGYAVKKQGDATIALVGPPSVGKSTLINKLTNVTSKVAPYAFTTVSVIPGMMKYKNARIQILDVPGLIKGAEEGKGRGREVLSVVRGCDLLLIMTDPENLDALKRLYAVLERNGIRPDQKKPNVIVEKKLSGGVIIHSNIKQALDKKTILSVVNEMGIKNAEITISEKLTINSLIDTLSKNRVYISTLKVLNKIDQVNNNEPLKEIEDAVIKISAENSIGLDELKKEIWHKLNFVTVFLVRQDEEPSYKNPIIMRVGQTLFDIAQDIGTEFAEEKKRAKIWGNGAHHPGQEVSLKVEVKDGMQVRFI
jgi:hypothetical protein